MRRYPAVFRDLFWYRTNVPCMEACPVHTDSGRYVQLIAEARYRDAFLVARSPNPLASICGRICAAPCEDACRRRWIDEAVSIRPLKRFVTEQFGAESANPDTYRELAPDTDFGCQRLWHMAQMRNGANGRGRKVAVIGAGPAGMACAHDLAMFGYTVNIFEALERPGGMLRYGVPEYRLPRGVIDREFAVLQSLGVTTNFDTPLTAEFNLRSLRRDGYDAVFLAVGAMRGRDLQIPGHDKDGVIKAVDYLLNLNRGYRTELGERVVVIGGGSVALDAARTAVREFYQPLEEIEMTASVAANQAALDAARGAMRAGAKEVHVVSLESLEEMPAARTVQGKEELREALAEGIRLVPSWGPQEIHGDRRVQGITLKAVTRAFDDRGRFAPQFDEAKTMRIDADAVILAIGQQPDFSFLSPEDHIELTAAGTIKIDPATLATTASGVFAGGDAAFGPRIVIEAVANGKRAAQSIHEFLSATRSDARADVRIKIIPKHDYSVFAEYEKKPRHMPPVIESGRRTGIAEVEHVYGEVEARRQAERCLMCHIDTIYDPELCVLCGRCADVCPERCLIFVPLADVDLPAGQRDAALAHYGYGEDQPLTVLLKDDTACIRCGLCAARCPTEAMTMERFDFVEERI